MFDFQMHWMTLTGPKSKDYHAWFIECIYSYANTWFISCMITQCFLPKLYSSNEIANAVYDKLHAAVSKYVHEFADNLNTDEIWLVIDMVMILNFLQQLISNSRKFKIIIISIMH